MTTRRKPCSTHTLLDTHPKERSAMNEEKQRRLEAYLARCAGRTVVRGWEAAAQQLVAETEAYLKAVADRG